jgi:hypothetical protein
MCALRGYNPRENGILKGASLFGILGVFGNANNCLITCSILVLQNS